MEIGIFAHEFDDTSSGSDFAFGIAVAHGFRAVTGYLSPEFLRMAEDDEIGEHFQYLLKARQPQFIDDTVVTAAIADMDGESVFSVKPNGAFCLVIGNEGHGLSEAVISACDRSVYIPMEADTESLNAGVAAALIMWELCKK